MLVLRANTRLKAKLYSYLYTTTPNTQVNSVIPCGIIKLI